jgi:hypothetical protein
MKVLSTLVILGVVCAQEEPKEGSVHFFDFDAGKMLYHGNWEEYRDFREKEAQGDASNNCRLAESDNFMGAQQCKYSWECRGARECERGGWCSGFDGCEGTALPL